MKHRFWAPVIAVALAALILVPTTFAVGEPGTTLYAQLGQNRFPGGQGAADASLTFNSQRDIVLRIQILGPAGTVNAVRVYVDGTCTAPGEWVINRTTNAGQNGPFLTVNSNSGVNTIQVNQLDVDRVREELAGNPNETFALMVARVINGQNYRTCTQFRSTPFPPLTTTTTAATQTTATNTTRLTTRTVTTVIGTQTLTFTLTEPVTTGATTTRTSTGFSTGTTVQTITTLGTGTTVTLAPTATVTNTATQTSTGFSTGTATFTSDLTSTTVTGTTTFTTPVTTSTITQTQTQTLGGTTFTTFPSTTFTTTNLTTAPVTTVTLVL